MFEKKQIVKLLKISKKKTYWQDFKLVNRCQNIRNFIETIDFIVGCFC